ncbi:hypothetical protein EI94DRAFT_1782758 [Lactarius quietus]|nr:hypothetical protein EI94DRAFT_1782758 [Lactarius quietus]
MRSILGVILFFLPLVSALTFTSVPTNATSGGSVTIPWSSTSTDPSTFSLELVNPTLFNNAIAIANNVATSTGTITVTLPIVPASGGYTIQAVDISNINSVYATSGGFSIGATVSTTSSSTTPSSSSSLPSGSVTSPASSQSTSGSGVSVTPTSSSVSSGTSSGASSSASPSSFNGNGALGSNIGSGIGGSIAAAVVGVIAGAVFV